MDEIIHDVRIVHVASFDVKPTIGAGRASYFWKLAFEAAGHEFIHVGLDSLGKIPHLLLFGYYAKGFVDKNIKRPDIFLVHEPASGFFIDSKIPLVVFSHGLEERAWEINEQYQYEFVSLKARLIPKRLRFFSNSRGLKRANLLLLSNRTDQQYVVNRLGQHDKNIFIFHNGYFDVSEERKIIRSNRLRILYNAGWIKRKGYALMIEALSVLKRSGIDNFDLVLIGVGDGNKVLNDVPAALQDHLKIVENFSLEQEKEFLSQCQVFLLPSYYEGQSLALTQAMAAGLCCVVSNNSGQIDFIEDGVNGLLFETGNVASLSEKLRHLLTNIEMAHTLGKAAAESVRHLTWPFVTSEIVSKITKLLPRQTGSFA